MGARGLLTMGIAAVDARVQHPLEAVAEEAERRVASLLEQGRRAFGDHYEPERRFSLIPRALDPDADGSTLARLGAAIEAPFCGLHSLIVHTGA